MSLTALLFLAAFGVGSVLALTRAPIYGLATYVATFYLHPPSRWWGQGILEDIRWPLLAAAVTLLALLVHKPKLPLTRILRSGPFWTLVVFVAWIAVQSIWALDAEAHSQLLSIYWKFIVVMILVTRCIQSERDLKIFLWVHALGCAYLGYIAYTSYGGGRFEGFGGPGLGEANAAALVLVTGMAVAGSLFLTGGWRAKAGVVGIAPLIVNALVTTISRSGFLAMAVAGIVFNWLVPPKFKTPVRVLSVLALVLLAMLTNDVYWGRMETIKYGGETVEGVDTGAGRLATIEAQLRMATSRPLGCGHQCTTYLSYTYLDPKFHSVQGGRASHNTFMSMLVDHGIPGAAIYVLMAWWALTRLLQLRRTLVGSQSLLAGVLPAVGGALIAMLIGDLFVQYIRLEVRIWFIAVLMVMLHFAAQGKLDNASCSDESGISRP